MFAIRQGAEQSAAEGAGLDAGGFARATLDALSEHVAVLDRRGTLVLVNRAWREFAAANSRSPAGLSEGANYFGACAGATGEGAEDAARFAAGLRAVIAGELHEFSLEYPCHSPAEQRWFVARVTRFELGGEPRAVVTHANITARKLAEQRLVHSESKYRLLLEQASDGIHTYDERGGFIEANSKLCEMLGYARAELLRMNVRDLVPPADLAASPIRFDELRAGRTLMTERRLLRKDGTLVPVEISGRMIGDGVLQAIIRDVSERKRAEAELHEAYDALERRVAGRTSELARANATLKAEIAERQRAEEGRRELLLRLVTAQEEERRRISRELHDQMGQQLAALMIGLKALDADSYGRPAARAALGQLQELTGRLSHEAHTLAWALRPPALDDLGLHAALCNYVEEWAGRSRIAVDFHSAGFDGGRLPFTHETTLYRIAQEALTNVLKHSRADRVSFILERRGDHVLAVIEDNGKGFDADALAGSHGSGRRLGLLGMRERVSLLGGTLNVESSPGAGTSVFVRVPVAAGDGGEEGGGPRV